MKTLADLRIGDRVRVTGLKDEGGVPIRLMEMGVIPGCEVELLGVAPLGDPLEFSLRGYRLSIRKSEAALVLVEPLPPQS